ncbi:hypothetical protein [Neisseria sp.]
MHEKSFFNHSVENHPPESHPLSAQWLRRYQSRRKIQFFRSESAVKHGNM